MPQLAVTPGHEVAPAEVRPAVDRDRRKDARRRAAAQVRIRNQDVHHLLGREKIGRRIRGVEVVRQRYLSVEIARALVNTRKVYPRSLSKGIGIGPVSVRQILVDDHPIVLGGLQQLLQRQPDFTVLAACGDADTAMTAIEREPPDVLVLDLRMPGTNGLEFLRRLADAGVSVKSVLLTAAIEDAEVSEAVRLGVAGLVMKDSTPDTLVECVRKVHAGGQWLDHEIVNRALRSALDRDAAVRDTALTPREIEIVRMVAEGLRNRAIATRLSISEGTVKVHLHNIYEKLGVDGRLELTLVAQQKKLL